MVLTESLQVLESSAASLVVLQLDRLSGGDGSAKVGLIGNTLVPLFCGVVHLGGLNQPAQGLLVQIAPDGDLRGKSVRHKSSLECERHHHTVRSLLHSL